MSVIRLRTLLSTSRIGPAAIGLVACSITAASASVELRLGQVPRLSMYTVTLPELGEVFTIEKTQGGYLVVNGSDPSGGIVVGSAALDESSIVVHESEANRWSATFTTPAGIAEQVSYRVTGSYDPHQERFAGDLARADGDPIGSIQIRAPGAGQQKMEIIIVVVLTAAAIFALGCSLKGLLTDCSYRCMKACWATFVCWIDERMCGRCQCACADADGSCPNRPHD